MSIDMETWTCSIDMKHGDMDKQYGDENATWTSSMEEQHRQAAWTCNMDFDMEHGYVYAAWTWTCSIDMLYGHQ